MTDGIQKGAGNAYRLQAPANALSLYPTHESLVEALASGEFFADLKLNPEGWNPLGTSLSKANLLKDATAALYGKTAAAVPDDIFAAIRPLITTAQNTANSAPKIELVSYSGTGTSTNTIYFSIKPKIVIVSNLSTDGYHGIFVYPSSKGLVTTDASGSSTYPIPENKRVNLTWSSRNINIISTYEPALAPAFALNSPATQYSAFAIG